MSAISLMSAPAANTRSPPYSTTAWTALSASACRAASAISRCTCPFSAFIFGRSNLIVAICSATSTRTNSPMSRPYPAKGHKNTAPERQRLPRPPGGGAWSAEPRQGGPPSGWPSAAIAPQGDGALSGRRVEVHRSLDRDGHLVTLVVGLARADSDPDHDAAVQRDRHRRVMAEELDP